jgi:hypothetical protein
MPSAAALSKKYNTFALAVVTSGACRATGYRFIGLANAVTQMNLTGDPR